MGALGVSGSHLGLPRHQAGLIRVALVIIAVIPRRVISTVIGVRATSAQVLQFPALAFDFPALLFDLVVLGILSLRLALHLIANQPTAQRAEPATDQRAFARVVVTEADVLLLDEPTNNLDPISRDQVLDALRTYTGAIVLVTHDEGAVDALAPEKVILLPDGVEDSWSDDLADLIALA